MDTDTLERELHHRVANNIQLMLGLLDLQLESTSSVPARKALFAAKRRLWCLSRVTELDLATGGLGCIDLLDLVKSLSMDMMGRYSTMDRRIVVSIDGESLTISTGHALPAGLILSELMTNSYFHAEPKEGICLIEISWKTILEGGIEFKYRDHGGGYPHDVLKGKTEGRHLLFLKSLARQMDLKLEFFNSPEGGAETTIRAF